MQNRKRFKYGNDDGENAISIFFSKKMQEIYYSKAFYWFANGS